MFKSLCSYTADGNTKILNCKRKFSR